MRIRKVLMLILAVISIQSLTTARIVNTADNQIVVKDYTILTTDTVVMNGKLFIDSGAVLTIQEGALIKGKTTQSAMVICRGSKIIAKGTKTKPIIFTAFKDSLKGTFTDSIKPYTMGLWGGLVILGRARISASADTAVFSALMTNNHRSVYGGTKDDDTSGILEYVSIRFAGSGTVEDDPDVADSEDDVYDYAGLTLCGVGSGTVIQNIDVFNSKLDGVRLWGGSVNLKNFSVSFSHDNCLDIDQGYHGRCQYFLLMYRSVDHLQLGGSTYEGGKNIINHRNHQGSLLPVPVFSNFTVIGDNNLECQIASFENEATGKYYNGLLTQVGKIKASNSKSNLENGSLFVSNSTFYNKWNGSSNLWTDFSSDINVLQMIAQNNSLDTFILANTVTYPYILTSSDPVRSIWDFKPVTGTNRDNFLNLFQVRTIDSLNFDPVSFKGAFDPCNPVMWIRGWTAIDHFQFLEKNDKSNFPGLCLVKNSNYIAGNNALKNDIRVHRIGKKVVLDLSDATLMEKSVGIYRLNGTEVKADILFDKQRIIIDLGSSHLSAGQYFCRVKTKNSVKSIMLPNIN